MGISNSIQSNIKGASDDATIRDYSLFLGGLNAKNNVLGAYTPLKTGYARIFMIKSPAFMMKWDADRTKSFRHLVEYGFIGVDGIQNTTLETEQLTGGYAGRQLDVATTAKDETNEITIRLYEFSGSPVRAYIDAWVTGISDPLTGLSHYHGVDTSYSQKNHTAEMIYLVTDPTGKNIEYACMFANMMPKQVKKDHFNYEAGQHNIVQVDIPFTAVKYESPDINLAAAKLLEKYTVLMNGYNFKSGYISGTSLDGDEASGSNITDK